MKNFKLAAVCAGTLLAFAVGSAPAWAGPITWDFFTLGGSPPPQGVSLGSTTHTFTQGGLSLFTQSAISTGCGSLSWCASQDPLYIKNGGTPGEQGLGLLYDAYGEHEITDPHGIYLNLNHAGGYATSVDMGSVQSGETWAVWGNKGSGWIELASGTGTGASVDFNNSSVLAGYNQLIVTDPFKMNQTGATDSNNIILASITTVPEPGALALFAAGLLGCALFVTRRRAARRH